MKSHEKPPSIRQQIAAKEIAENIRNGRPLRPMGKVLKDAGFAESTSLHPDRVTNSKSWKVLIERYLPESLIAKTHKELMTAHKLDHMIFPVAVTDEQIKALLESVGCKIRQIMHGEQGNHAYFWSPDNHARDNALDKAYKLKGKYAPTRVYTEPDPFDEMPDEELDRAIAEAKAELDKRKKAK